MSGIVTHEQKQLAFRLPVGGVDRSGIVTRNSVVLYGALAALVGLLIVTTVVAVELSSCGEPL